MENKTCKACNASLEIESTCKVCQEPTRLFCHACGIVTEKYSHPACLAFDVEQMLVQVSTSKK